MTQLMDAEDVNEVIVPAFSHSPNPFLSGHQCLLCRCERPHLPKQNGDITGKCTVMLHLGLVLGTASLRFSSAHNYGFAQKKFILLLSV